jgi:sulfite reductase alpha subunit-like flavoprotein
VPPLSSGLTATFGHEMRDFVLDPQYKYQAEIWDIRGGSDFIEDDGVSLTATNAIKKLLVLYASETGTAEGYAYEAVKKLKPR